MAKVFSHSMAAPAVFRAVRSLWLHAFLLVSSESPPYAYLEGSYLCFPPAILEFQVLQSDFMHFNEVLQETREKIFFWKSCSTSWAVREIQLKNALQFQLTPVRMRVNKKTNDDKYWWDCGERGALIYCREGTLVWPLWKSLCGCLKKEKKKRKIRAPDLHKQPKESKSAYHRDLFIHV